MTPLGLTDRKAARVREVTGTARLFLAIMATVVLCPSARTAEMVVTDVRFWSLGDVTRVAVEVTGSFTYRHDRLSNPPRIFFDVLGASNAISGNYIRAIPVGDAILKQIRVGENAPAVTRIVLDLEQAETNFSASQLTNPNRLVIELRIGASAAPQDSPPPPPPAASTSPAVPPGPKMIPTPAQRSSTGTRSLTRALGLKVGRILLDAGHGGHDTGSIGPAGLMEKDLVLDITRRLGALLEKELGAEVIYTRTDDSFVPLEARTELANQKKADLFISIHANSSTLRSANGAETFYLSFTTSRWAMEVAARENAGSERSIHELKELLQKIAMKDKVDESREFALKVQEALTKGLGSKGAPNRDRGVKKAPFAVLIGVEMPAVLAEIGFLSNAREEALLKTERHRQRVAEALYKGISGYAQTLSHFQMAHTNPP